MSVHRSELYGGRWTVIRWHPPMALPQPVDGSVIAIFGRPIAPVDAIRWFENPLAPKES